MLLSNRLRVATEGGHVYQRYGIGAIARLLGLSTEAIRYYESRGIIQPVRDPETGYRYFNAWDLHMLLRARHYQSYGFSLEEIADLLRRDELADIESALAAKEEDIQLGIVRQINMLKRVRQSEAMVRDAKQSVGRYRIEARPGIYRINTQVEYALSHEKEDLERIGAWAGMTPFVYSCAVFRNELLREGDPRFDFGLGVNEEYAGILGIREEPGVEYYPPRTCLHTCVPSRSSTYLTPKLLDGALAYMDEHGLELAGDVVTQVACMVKPNDEYFNWHIVWIPIEAPAL